MKNATMAILYHHAEQHRYFPNGTTSWCGWKRDKANRTSEYTPKHQCLQKIVLNAVLPVFKQLSDKSGSTQNASESSNSLIWQKATKTVFRGRYVIETAVAMAVSVYNDGKTTLTSVLKELGILPGNYTEYGYWKQDLLRIYQMKKKSSDDGTAARKRNRRGKQKRMRMY